MRKLLVIFSLILVLFGSSAIVNAAVQKGTVNISSTLDGTVLTGGSDSQIDMGSVMNLDATAIGNSNVFAFWIVNDFVRTDLPAVTQLRVQSKMNLVAVFRSANKHAVLFVDSNGKLIDDVYVANGETATAPSTEGLTKPGGLTVVADEANRWISLEGNTSLAGISSSRVYVLQYEMPATSVEIMAIGALKEEFTANKNDVVTVVAADTANFKYWADEDGNVLSYNSTYSFTVLEEVIIEAESETVKAAESFVVMQDLTGIRSGHVSYMGRYELHGGDELVEFGFIYGNTIADIEMGMPNVDVAISNVANPATNEFLMSFVNEHHVTARAYAIVKNGEAIRTIYSDLVVKPNVQEIEAIRTTSGAVTSYGIVSGIMGTKYVFVQQKDGSAGIVLHNANIPAALAVGDEVIIRGTMGHYEGLIQVAAGGTIQILNSGNTVPLAVDLESTLKAFTVADQSKRFSASGLVVSSAYNSSSRTITVKDASNTTVTIRVELNTDTQLIEVLQELSINDVISISGMHLGWYDGAQFLFGNSSELLIDPLTIENKIKSSITTELDGKSFNEGSEVSLPTELFGVSILWTTNPVDLISGGVFKDVEADLNGATATAVFTVPGRDEVTQVATFTIKDVPAGTKVEGVIYETGFETGFSTGTDYQNTTELEFGPSAGKWGVVMGTPSTTKPISDSNSMQIRWYSGKPYGSTYTKFDLIDVTKFTFSAKATSGAVITVYISKDSGNTWISGEQITLSSTSATYTYDVNSSDLTGNFRIKIELTTNKNRTDLTIDDVIVYGMVDPA
ncbi:hypothetical protein [Acholeplasma laidlawii]|uniref:hypothetical protein n=1 Tax=Acholeplasma laidlawii TaxID=2148 RepID=UPI003F8F5CF4